MATIKLTRDFREFLELLDSEKIEYLLIGGYAVALYGYVRPTKDIDIWVACDSRNQERLGEALVKFGFSPSSIKQPLFEGEKTILRMGVPPNRLGVLGRISGVDFDDCYKRRQIMDIEGLQVPVISYDDLLRNKRASARPHDNADVDRLERRRNST